MRGWRSLHGTGWIIHGAREVRAGASPNSYAPSRDAIARIFFEISDSSCFSPIFWHGLPEEMKLWIIDTHFRSIQNREDVPPADTLVPDYQKDRYFALPITGFRSLA